MRWVWIALSMFGFALAWAARTPGWLGIGLLLGFGALFAALFAFAAARIEAVSRPDAMMLSSEELAQLRRRAEGQRAGTNPARSGAEVSREA